MPVAALVDDCPLYDLDARAAGRAALPGAAGDARARRLDARRRCSRCSRSPNIASRRPLFEQYDSIVQSRTVRRPEEADAAVLALPGGARARGAHRRQRPPRRRRPVLRARSRSCSSARRTSPASGAEPLGTDQLPELRQPREAAHRLAAHRGGARASATPAARSRRRSSAATSRSTTRAPTGPIYPTPGHRHGRRAARRRARRPARRSPRRATRSRSSGTFAPSLAGERAGEAARRGAARRAAAVRHRRGDRGAGRDPRGGPRGPAVAARTTSPRAASLVAVAECCLAGGIGATLDLGPSEDPWTHLFGEGPGGFVVSGHPTAIAQLAERVPLDVFGAVGGDALHVAIAGEAFERPARRAARGARRPAAVLPVGRGARRPLRVSTGHWSFLATSAGGRALVAGSDQSPVMSRKERGRDAGGDRVRASPDVRVAHPQHAEARAPQRVVAARVVAARRRRPVHLAAVGLDDQRRVPPEEVHEEAARGSRRSPRARAARSAARRRASRARGRTASATSAGRGPRAARAAGARRAGGRREFQRRVDLPSCRAPAAARPARTHAAAVGGRDDVAEVDERARRRSSPGRRRSRRPRPRASGRPRCTRMPGRDRLPLPGRDGHVDDAGPVGQQVRARRRRRCDRPRRPRRRPAPPRVAALSRSAAPLPTTYTPRCRRTSRPWRTRWATLPARQPERRELRGRHEAVPAGGEARDRALARVVRAALRVRPVTGQSRGGARPGLVAGFDQSLVVSRIERDAGAVPSVPHHADGRRVTA